MFLSYFNSSSLVLITIKTYCKAEPYKIAHLKGVFLTYTNGDFIWVNLIFILLTLLTFFHLEHQLYEGRDIGFAYCISRTQDSAWHKVNTKPMAIQ
jgi:hypothetical protein